VTRHLRSAALAALFAVGLTACGGSSGAGQVVQEPPATQGSDATSGDGGSLDRAYGDTDAATDTDAGTDASQGGASPADAAAAAAVLDWTAPALAGGEISGADFAGGDVVLWMWAPW
jgi:hypothetical protein